ncbi:MAG TPA: site-specific integrase [Streptosporangiaceae bacterium]|nr:site-specific integrase [Streptosporangiaceae bacterium]
MGRPASKVTRVLVTGPLAPFAPMLKARLRERGYTPLSTVIVMRLVAHLSRWLDANALGVSDLAGEQVERYIAARRGEGRTSALSPHSVDSILAMLADAGALVPETVAVPATGQEALLSDFRRHLLGERALTPSTAAAYVAYARRFLAGFAGEGLAGLTAADVTRAVTAEAQAVSASSAQYFVAALRAFLRFCFLEGLLGADLAGAALAVTGRRRSPLPKGISRASAQALLASCDRRRPAGRRDYAVLVTLLRLGLRASEAAGLRLDDIDWRAAELTVHGKGRRDERLPLPADVGQAIAAYLTRGRPVTASREVFVRAVAPAGPLSRGGISFIVRHACRRAGVPPVGAHRLRHTAACQMAEAGAPLTEIGQLLRHKSLASTANYARVSVTELRKLAQPWPSGGDRS